MGAATKGGGAVTKGPRNKVLSKPSTKIKVMMKKGGEVKKYNKGGPVDPLQGGTTNPSRDRAYNDPALGHQAAMKRVAADEKRKQAVKARRTKTTAGAKKASQAAKTKKGSTTRGGSGTSGLAGSSVKLMRKGGKVKKYRKGGSACG